MPAMTARAANKRETVSQPWAAGSTDGVFAPYNGYARPYGYGNAQPYGYYGRPYGYYGHPYGYTY
jgi:hypothetical protein